MVQDRGRIAVIEGFVIFLEDFVVINQRPKGGIMHNTVHAVLVWVARLCFICEHLWSLESFTRLSEWIIINFKSHSVLYYGKVLCCGSRSTCNWLYSMFRKTLISSSCKVTMHSWLIQQISIWCRVSQALQCSTTFFISSTDTWKNYALIHSWWDKLLKTYLLSLRNICLKNK